MLGKVSKKIKELRIMWSPVAWYRWRSKWGTFPVRAWLVAAHYFRASKYSEALKWYKEGLLWNANHRAAPYARLDYAFCLFKQEQWREAASELERVISSGKKIRQAYLLQAEIYSLVGESTKAVSVLKRWLSFFPRDVRAVIVLSDALVQLNASTHELKMAKNRLVELTKLDSVKAKDLDAITVCLTSLDVALGTEPVTGEDAKTKGVTATKRRNAKCAPDTAIMSAEHLLKRSEIVEARGLLKSALRDKPNSAKAYALLAKTYLIPGVFYQPEWGQQMALLACQKSFWQNPLYLQILADAYELVGDSSAALLVAERAKNLVPKKPISVDAVRYLDAQVERLRR